MNIISSNYFYDVADISTLPKNLDTINAFIFQLDKIKFALRIEALYRLGSTYSSIIYHNSNNATLGISFLDNELITIIDIISVLNWHKPIDKSKLTRIIEIQNQDLHFGILISDDYLTGKIIPKKFQQKINNQLIEKTCTFDSEEVFLINETLLFQKVQKFFNNIY